MKCRNCQYENPEGSRFCEDCGAMLEDIQINVPAQPGTRKPHQNVSGKSHSFKALEEKPKFMAAVWVGVALFFLLACSVTILGGGYYYLRSKGLALKDLFAARQNGSASIPTEDSETKIPEGDWEPTLQDNSSSTEVTKTAPAETETDRNQAVSEHIVVVAEKHIWIINEQTGKKEILSDYPLNNFWDIQTGLSPNKKWFAYFTGFEKESITPQLLVLDLENRQIVLQLPLNDPSAQSAMAEEVGEPEFEASRAMQMPQSLAWSPDGSTLAFIARRDGESADVYLFNPVDLSVARVSEEAGHANDLHWSPNGTYLQYLSTNSFGTGGGSNMEALWVYDFRNRKAELLENLMSSGERFISWTDNSHFLIASTSSICELHNLRLVNVTRSFNQVILNGCFNSIAYNPINQNGMFSVTDFNFENCDCGEKLDAGLWIFGNDIGYPVVGEIGLKKFEQVQVYDIEFIDQSNLFTVYGDEGLLSIYKGNDFYRVDLFPEEQALTPYKSPNAENWAWASLVQSDLWFSDENNKAVELSTSSTGLPVWSADGQRLYFFENNRIFLVSAPGFDSRVLLAELPAEAIIALVR